MTPLPCRGIRNGTEYACQSLGWVKELQTYLESALVAALCFRAVRALVLVQPRGIGRLEGALLAGLRVWVPGVLRQRLTAGELPQALAADVLAHRVRCRFGFRKRGRGRVPSAIHCLNWQR